MAADFILIHHHAFSAFARAVLEAVTVPPHEAALVADSLVAANLRGVDSHGIQLLFWYAEQIRSGNIAVAAHGHVATESGACMVYDGEYGLGQVVSDICCDHAIRLARTHGLGMVSVRDSSHFGACAWCAQKVSERGLLPIVPSNAPPLAATCPPPDHIL